jgi:hypothetical protein
MIRCGTICAATNDTVFTIVGNRVLDLRGR